MVKPALTLHLPGGVPMTFRFVPAGESRMGSRGFCVDEEPPHRVLVSHGFWLGGTPITQAQFAVWTAAEKIKHKNEFKGHSDHPAESLDWWQANRFCAWLTRVARGQMPAGWRACLPTEAEWEYACRAGTETEYYTGDGEAALAEAGWYDDNSESSTHPVGLKVPNAFGLYDLHGNVWEWCHDVWDAAAYRPRVDGEIDPGQEQRLQDWRAGLQAMVASDQARVLRGGSWCNRARYCRSALRVGFTPGRRGRGFGFRVCLVPGPWADRTGRRGAPRDTTPGDGGRGTSPESDGAAISRAVPGSAPASPPRAAVAKSF